MAEMSDDTDDNITILDLLMDFKEHYRLYGRDAICRLAEENPDAYLRLQLEIQSTYRIVNKSEQSPDAETPKLLN